MLRPSRPLNEQIEEGFGRFIERRPLIKKVLRGVFVLATAGALRQMTARKALAEHCGHYCVATQGCCPSQGFLCPNPDDWTQICPTSCKVCTLSDNCPNVTMGWPAPQGCPYPNGWWISGVDINVACYDCRCPEAFKCEHVCVCYKVATTYPT